VITVELAVTGMHCDSCAALIEEVLAEQPGLASARVDLASARAEVTYDDAVTDVDVLQAAISELGYAASPVETTAQPPP
jgi:copper chaperone CopZ